MKLLDSVVATNWMQGDLGRAIGWGFARPFADPSGSFPEQGSVPVVDTRPVADNRPGAGSCPVTAGCPARAVTEEEGWGTPAPGSVTDQQS